MTVSFRSRLLSLTILVVCTQWLATPLLRDAHAGCNLIPPAERSYPSTVGSVVSPITIPGRTVELRLGPCDGATGFDPVAANNTVTLTFEPPAGPTTNVPITIATIGNCTGGDCGLLTFVMPDTTGLLPPDGLAGPARITVVRGVTTVADIGPLAQPRPSATACSDEAEPIFEHFTVLPKANDFNALAMGAPQMLGTLDGGGNLLIPFDYEDVLPLGPGEPVARLVSAFATLDAFAASPGVPIVVPDTTYARSFTVDGRPLPPLLRATATGDAIFGTTDALQAIIRVARTDGAGGPAIFDLSDRFSNGGRGPIVMTTFSAESGAPVPLANLQSSGTGVAYARDESLEAENLNFSSGDTDEEDRVVQILDGATGISTSTGMAAANPHSPLVGPAAVTTARGMVAFLESERDQNATDLNGDGDALDHVLRVFDLAGTEITPSATLLGDSFPAVGRQPVAIVGDLVFYREPVAGVSLLNYSYAGPHADPGEGSIAVSPNGQWIVGTGRLDSIIRFNRRDPETGGLKDNSSYSNGDEGFSGLGGASGVVFGPDSNFFYVAGSSDNAVNVGSINGLYPQDENVILLSAIDVEVDGVGGVDGLTGVTRLAISPAGDHLYAAGTGEDAIAVFSRNAGTGALAFVAALFNGAGAGSDLDEPRGLAVSPDGKHVYVAAHASSAVTAFTRNLMTGELTFLASYPDGGLGGPSLAGAREVVVSSDGMNVYVAADTDSAVSVFGRDAVTGGLTFLEAKVEGVSGVSGIAAVQSLAIAPDARTVYAGGDASGFAVFERVTPGGALSFVEAEDVNFLPFTPTRSLAMSPDSEHLYAFYDAAPNAYLYGWERNGRLRTFDTMTGMPRPGLGAEPASLAAAAAGRAVFLSPEGNSGGTNRNGDSDTDDRLVYAYDAATDTVTQLTNVSAFAADRVALSAQVLALEIPEGSQTPPVDLDGNGQFNSVVGVVPTSALVSPPQIVPVNVSTLSGVPIGIAATDVCSSGSSTGDACQTDGDCPGGTCQGVVVFGAGEGVRVGFGFVGTDLNGDGDIHDDVPGIYRTATGQVTFVPQSLMDFVVGGNLIAFRSSENDEGDLNGDGDTLDAVLFVYDLKHDRLINTRQSVVVCDLPGCSPGQEYKVLRDSVAFLTRESDQGDQDLDGDGSATGIVAQIFNVRSAHRKAFSTRAGAPNLPPLPDDFIGQPIVYQERDESVEGIDLNGDGDTDDGIVNVITGDNDGDGVFNEDDTCVEAQDDAALDSDLDGLGDVCDPNPYCSTLTPANPPVAPLANEKCQKALGKAVRGYLTARANTIRGCLGAITKGKLAGRAAVTCRGSLFAGQEVTPADAKTASKLAKARLKLDKTIAGKCTTGDLGALDPCATSVADVQRCLADRITSGVETMLALAYGDVAAIADKATLKCQSAIGSAAVGYLKTAVGAMVRCLDARNAGKISGDGQSLCLGASTPSGITAPTDPSAGTKLAKADAKLLTAVTAKCAGVLPNVDTCGTTPTAVHDCLACTGWRRVVEAVRGAYGVP